MRATGARHLGIFGGTFDPPHIGHLLVAGDAAEKLSLDVVLWVPTATQPLKSSTPPQAAASDRRRMVELTIAGDARFVLEPMEIDRNGLSFTVETLDAVRRRESDAELFLLLGADTWATFSEWRDPARVRDLATVVVLTRRERATEGLHTLAESAPGGPPMRLATRRIDVSATEIRRRIREGLSIRGFVTDAVEKFLAESSLYR